MEDLELVLKEIKDGLKKLHEDHTALNQAIDKRYSEENNGELIVATGSFALLVNFLINLKKPEHTWLLIAGVSLLVLNIILKFHILRQSADRAIQERVIVRKKLDSTGNLYALVIKHSLHKENQEILQEIMEENNNLKSLEKDFENLPKKWSNLVNLNELEYYLFSVGLGLILIFFSVNLIN